MQRSVTPEEHNSLMKAVVHSSTKIEHPAEIDAKILTMTIHMVYSAVDELVQEILLGKTPNKATLNAVRRLLPSQYQSSFSHLSRDKNAS